VNWAKANLYKVRPRGMMHNWSPLTFTPGSSADNVLLVDTTQYLTSMSIASGSPATVTAQTGVTMESLLTQLETGGLRTHGDSRAGRPQPSAACSRSTATAARSPRTARRAFNGSSYGSVSNLVTSITAVVWDSASSAYVLKTFARSSAACQALLAHVGRSFIVSATLQVRANYRLRCQSWFDIAWADLFAPASSTYSRKFSNYISSSGRVEAIWFPFTNTPWVKVWTPHPSKPLFSKQVNSPYNYSFSDNLPSSITDLAGQIIAGNPSLAPTFGATQISVVGGGLIATGTWDIWGWSKNSLLYVKPTTLRVTAKRLRDHHTSRANIQRVVNEFATTYNAKLTAYQAQGKYPMNGPVEIRVDRARQDQRGRRRERRTTVAVDGSPAAGSLRLGRGGVARHPHHSRHAVRRPVLSGDRAVDLLELLGFVCVGPAGVVERLGLLEHGRMVGSDDAGHDGARVRSTPANPRARSSPTPAPRSTRTTRRASSRTASLDTFLP